MIDARAPRVTIWLNDRRIRVCAPGHDRVCVPRDPFDKLHEDLVGRLDDQADQYVQHGDDFGRADWKCVDQFVREFNQAGVALIQHLFGNDSWRVRQMFRAAVPPRLRARPRLAPPVLQILGDDAGRGTPFELLPLLGARPYRRVNNAVRLNDALAAFPAFSMIVDRAALRGGNAAPPPFAGGPTVVSFLGNRTGDGIGGELALLERMDEGKLHLNGPFPSAPADLPKCAKVLAACIRNSSYALTERRLPTPAHVLHLACHCFINHANSECSSLDFGDTQHAVTILKLLNEIDAISHEDGHPPAFVFLNACASVQSRPPFISPFLSILLRRQNHSGILGTRVLVPTRFAEAFAIAFYRRAIKGTSVGRAVVGARRAMAAGRYLSPLGLIYSMFARAHLKIGR